MDAPKYIFVAIVNSSYYDDVIPRIITTFYKSINAEKWKNKYQIDVTEYAKMDLPELDKCHTQEDYDLFNRIKQAKEFI